MTQEARVKILSKWFIQQVFWFRCSYRYLYSLQICFSPKSLMPDAAKSLIRSSKNTKLSEKHCKMLFLLVGAVKQDFRQPLMFEELLPRWPESFDLISPSAPELIARKLFFALQIPFLLRPLEKQTAGVRLLLAHRVGCTALHSDTMWAAGHSHTHKQIRSALLWTVSSPGPPPDSQHNAGEKHPLEMLSDHPCMHIKKREHDSAIVFRPP